MHLQEHRGRQMRNGLGHSDHRSADDICGSTLDRGVDGSATGKPGGRAFGVDLGRVDLAAKEGLHETVLLGEGSGAVHVFADAWETFEVGVDEGLRLGPGDAQVACKTKARDAVNHAEIDGLGAAAHHRVHAFNRYTEHLAGGHCVDVDTFAEGLFQCRNVGDMGENPELDLAVVEADQPHTGAGYERFADPTTFVGTDRDVLQVRVGRCEAACVGPRNGV